MEDREPGIQSSETLVGKYRACMQLGWAGAEKPLPAGADSGFHETVVRALFSRKERDKKVAKNISSDFLASFGRQLTETEDIEVELQKATPN